MNKVYDRSTLNFMYLKNNPQNIYLLYQNGDYLYEFKSNCLIDSKDILYNNESLVCASIDLLLYYIPTLEYLHKNYTIKEMNLRKINQMPPNNYRKNKYVYTFNELIEMNNIINQECLKVLKIVQYYNKYLQNRHHDPLLRIYTELSF